MSIVPRLRKLLAELFQSPADERSVHQLATAVSVGIAVGFGAQNFIKDVIAGVMVLVEDQYSVGDVVRIGGVTGTVEEIRMRTTVLRGLDGSVHHVPHGGVNVSTNFTYELKMVAADGQA